MRFTPTPPALFLCAMHHCRKPSVLMASFANKKQGWVEAVPALNRYAACPSVMRVPPSTSLSHMGVIPALARRAQPGLLGRNDAHECVACSQNAIARASTWNPVPHVHVAETSGQMGRRRDGLLVRS